jgi:diguanylate cyclase (GGDEF)-like protein
MTVHGSDAAIPAGDDAWDAACQREFERALPVILADVFGRRPVEALVGAICAGAEELVDHVEAELAGVDLWCLDDVVFGLHEDTALDDTVWALALRTQSVELRVPLVSAGVRLGELVAQRTDAGWFTAQARHQLCTYASLVAPLLYCELQAEALRRAALTDQLTGLANRRALDHELERLCADGGHVCLLLFDVDGLKEVNDSLGYDQGDHLISTLARTLTEAIAADQVAARMGGDEFIVIMPGATVKQARKRARKIARAFARQPMPPRVAELSAGVSVGVIASRPGEAPRDLVRRAARSMRTNKRRRRTDRP